MFRSKNSLSVTAGETQEAASTAHSARASSGSRRADDASNTAATSPHASPSVPSHQILKTTEPCLSHPGEEEGLFIRDLRPDDADVSLYRGTR